MLQGDTDRSSLEVSMSNTDETWNPPQSSWHEASQGRAKGADRGKRQGTGRAKGMGRAYRVKTPEETTEAVELSSAARGRPASRRRRSTRGRQAARGRGNTASSGLCEEDRLMVSRLQEDRRLMTQVSMDILQVSKTSSVFLALTFMLFFSGCYREHERG